MPRDYLPVDLVRRVREAAGHRCGYCLSPQRLVMARLEVEHVIPVARGGTDDESNLWLSCPLCNRSKGDRTVATDPETGAVVPLFHPRRQRWSDHSGGPQTASASSAGRRPGARASRPCTWTMTRTR